MSAKENWDKEVLRITLIVQIPRNTITEVNFSSLQSSITGVAPMDLGKQKLNSLYEIPPRFQKPVKKGGYLIQRAALKKKKNKVDEQSLLWRLQEVR